VEKRNVLVMGDALTAEGLRATELPAAHTGIPTRKSMVPEKQRGSHLFEKETRKKNSLSTWPVQNSVHRK